MFRGDFGRAGEIVMTATALVEMACWDIMGKALDQPVYRLLGGAVRDKIRAYANGWYTVERSPEEFHARGQDRAMAKGYRALKFDPFGAGFYELERAEKNRVISLVEAVRDAVGLEVEILVEMHGRFNPATAIEMARAGAFQARLVRGTGAAREPGSAEKSGSGGGAAGSAAGNRRAPAHPLRIPRAV
jgi:galactonate dehydratase